MFLSEGVKRRTKVLKRLRLICPDVVTEIETKKASDDRRASTLVWFLKNFKYLDGMDHKLTTQNNVKHLHVVRYFREFFFSKKKIS